MKIAIGMETKLRPDQNYLWQTIANLKRAGVLNHPDASLDLVHGEDCTRQQNAQRAIARAVQQAKGMGAEWVMKLEDDLDFTDDFLGNVQRWLADHGNKPYAMFTFGATFDRVSLCRFTEGATTIFEERTSFAPVRQALAHGDTAMAGWFNGFWGAQCLVWRTDIAQHLANWLGDDPVYVDGAGVEHRQRGHDLLLQRWAASINASKFLASAPSFVQHIGERSNLDQPEINHKQPFFQFPFGGRDYRHPGGRHVGA